MNFRIGDISNSCGRNDRIIGSKAFLFTKALMCNSASVALNMKCDFKIAINKVVFKLRNVHIERIMEVESVR